MAIDDTAQKAKRARGVPSEIAFNAKVAKSIGPRDGKITEYRFPDVPGLVLVVQPSGAGAYFVRYQIGKGRKNRRQPRIKIGSRDVVDLAEARAKSIEIMKSVIIDKADPASDERARATNMTFRQLFDERELKHTERAAVTLKNYRDILELDVFPEIGNLAAAEITADQIARCLDVIEARSKSAAHKARSAIGSTYRWGLKRRLVRINPTVGLGFAYKSPARDLELSASEMATLAATLWAAFDKGAPPAADKVRKPKGRKPTELEAVVSEPMQIVLKLAVLTGQRIGQVVGVSTNELRGMGTANPMWRISGKRMKVKTREQIVPLSTQAAALFERALEIAAKGQPSNYVFPADMKRVKIGKTPRTPHMNQQSATTAMRRIRERLDIGDVVLHDMRKVITTWLRELKRTPEDVCDMILHHAKKGVTGSHYDFSVLEGPVRDAMQQWADHLDVLASGTRAETGNVLSLAAARAG
jgi:integrase